MSNNMRWALGILGGVGIAGAAMNMGGMLGNSQLAAVDNGSYSGAVSDKTLVQDLADLDAQLATVDSSMSALVKAPTLEKVVDTTAKMSALAGKKDNPMKLLADKLSQRVVGNTRLQALLNQANWDIQNAAAQISQAPTTATKSLTQGVAQLQKVHADLKDARTQMKEIFTSLNIR